MNDRATWERLVDDSPTPDVYFRPGYALAYEAAGHGEAVAIVANAGTRRYLAPLLLRPLPEQLAQPSSWRDAATPYGYGGLLPLDAPPDPAEVAPLFDELRARCELENIVTCFIRLHPMWHQAEWLRASGAERGVTIHDHGVTTALDLSKWDDERDRIAGMNDGRRSDLTRAGRFLELDWRRDAVDEFRAIYDDTMRRLDAASWYSFPPAYYAALDSGLGERLAIGLARKEGAVVGAAMFFADRDLAHYHLSGTTEVGRAYKATTFLINAGARWARQRGCRWLHLGGGVQEGDALFAFKKSFGGPQLTYSSLQLVVSQERYDVLCAARRSRVDLPAPRVGYFPAYRA